MDDNIPSSFEDTREFCLFRHRPSGFVVSVADARNRFLVFLFSLDIGNFRVRLRVDKTFNGIFLRDAKKRLSNFTVSSSSSGVTFRNTYRMSASFSNIERMGL